MIDIFIGVLMVIGSFVGLSLAVKYYGKCRYYEGRTDAIKEAISRAPLNLTKYVDEVEEEF